MIKIYLTNLGKYNEGELIGKWLELPTDDTAAALKDIGVEPGTQYEEYFITDYESDEIHGFTISEYENLNELNELAEQIQALDIDLLNAIIESETSELAAAVEFAGGYNHILYSAATLEDLVSEFVDGGLYDTAYLMNYIDFEALARDLSFEGYTETATGVLFTG